MSVEASEAISAMGCASSTPPKTMKPSPACKMDIKTQTTQTTQSQLAGQHAIDFIVAFFVALCGAHRHH
jgi:hypothetical protein